MVGFLTRRLNWLWQRLSGPVQWRVMWLVNAKFSLGVSGVAFDRLGRVLLVQAVFRRRPTWELPGGWVGLGETVEDAWTRELREETGVRLVGPARVLEVESGRGHRLTVVLVGEADEVGSLTPNFEIERAQWWSLDALPDDLPTKTRHVVLRAARWRDAQLVDSSGVGS